MKEGEKELRSEREIFEEVDLSFVLKELEKRNSEYRTHFLVPILIRKISSLKEKIDNDALLMNQNYPFLSHLGLTLEREKFFNFSQEGTQFKLEEREGIPSLVIKIKKRERLFRYLDFLIEKEELKDYQIGNLFALADIFWEEIFNLDWELMGLKREKLPEKEREILDLYKDEKLELLAALPVLSEKFQKISEKIRSQKPDFSPPFVFNEFLDLKEIVDHKCLAQYSQSLKYGLFLPFDHELSPLRWHTLLDPKVYYDQWSQIIFMVEEWIESIDSEEGKKFFAEKIFHYFNETIKKELLSILEKPSDVKERTNFPTFRSIYLKFLRFLNGRLKKIS